MTDTEDGRTPLLATYAATSVGLISAFSLNPIALIAAVALLFTLKGEGRRRARNLALYNTAIIALAAVPIAFILYGLLILPSMPVDQLNGVSIALQAGGAILAGIAAIVVQIVAAIEGFRFFERSA